MSLNVEVPKPHGLSLLAQKPFGSLQVAGATLLDCPQLSVWQSAILSSRRLGSSQLPKDWWDK